jgi:CheY-like chemotaxis protein
VSLLILVVDDEPDIETLFCQQFRRDLRAGRFVMEFALSAPDALRAIERARDVTLILILSDINMPGMSGLELLPKAKSVRPDVPIIMITAYGDAETKLQALEGGAEAVLIKPIDFTALRGEIEARLGMAT